MNLSNASTEPKLLADSMFGRLARWLRAWGYNTTYAPDTDDNELLRRARAEGRVLLTADRTLALRRGASILLVEAHELTDQLRQVRQALGPPPGGAFSRCMACNGELVRVDKSELADQLPPYVLATQNEFHRCPDCGRLFWPGTHVEHMRRVFSAP